MHALSFSFIFNYACFNLHSSGAAMVMTEEKCARFAKLLARGGAASKAGPSTTPMMEDAPSTTFHEKQPKERLVPTLHEGQPQESLGPTLHEKQPKERLGPTLHEGHT